MPVAILILLAVMLISALAATWSVKRKDAEKAVKTLMFVGYFWLLTFLQLILLAALYFLVPSVFSVGLS